MSVQLSDAPPIDMQQLHAQCMGRADFVERVLACFERQFGHDLEELQQLADRQDVIEVARVAHRMKGAAASSAAVRLTAECAVIQQWADNTSAHGASQFDELHQSIERLREEWDRFVQALSPTSRGSDLTEPARECRELRGIPYQGE